MRLWLGTSLEVLACDFGISKSLVNLIILMWASIESKRNMAFGKYPTVEEDIMLRPLSDLLLAEHPKAMIIKHDTTNININCKPTALDMQKITWNKYYNDNVMKAIVSNTTYGYNITFGMWTGGILDSDILQKCNVFKQQAEVLQEYLNNVPEGVDPLVTKVVNITDKGFRCDAAALQYSQSIYRAPLKMTAQLSPGDSIRTIFIAAGRGDNERMVRRPFMFGLMKRGFTSASSMDVADLLWLIINFKSNFLFRPLTLSTQVFIISPTQPCT